MVDKAFIISLISRKEPAYFVSAPHSLKIHHPTKAKLLTQPRGRQFKRATFLANDMSLQPDYIDTREPALSLHHRLQENLFAVCAMELKRNQLSPALNPEP